MVEKEDDNPTTGGSAIQVKVQPIVNNKYTAQCISSYSILCFIRILLQHYQARKLSYKNRNTMTGIFHRHQYSSVSYDPNPSHSFAPTTTSINQLLMPIIFVQKFLTYLSIDSNNNSSSNQQQGSYPCLILV